MIEKTNDENERKNLTQAAEAIMKICGNKSILINQMNPDNFLSIWEVLKPLMKKGLDKNALDNYQKDLLNLDNI